MSESLNLKSNFLITVAYRETRPFEQGKHVPHSETGQPVFFCVSARTDPESNAKHYEVEWGKPIR